MDPISTLETTAEISIAYAGFVSLFLLLARRDGSFEATVGMGIRIIVLASLFCLFWSALPLVVSSFGVTEAPLWRTSSGIVLVAQCVGWAEILRQRSRRQVSATPAVRVAQSLQVLAMVGNAANAVGWPWPPGPGLYIASLWGGGIGILSLNFGILVLDHLLGAPEETTVPSADRSGATDGDR